MKDILSANCRRWWANIRSTPQKNKGLFCMIVERAFGVTLSQALSRDANRKWLLSLRNNNLSRSTTVLIIRSHYNALVLCVCVCCFIVFFLRVHLNSVTPTVPHSELTARGERSKTIWKCFISRATVWIDTEQFDGPIMGYVGFHMQFTCITFTSIDFLS